MDSVPPTPDSGRGALAGAAAALGLWLLTYVVLSVATAAMTEDAMGSLGGTSLLILPLFAALALTLTTMWLILRGVMIPWPAGALVAGAFVCTAVSQGVHMVMHPVLGRDLGTVVQFGVANVALIGSSLFIGRLIAGRVDHLSWLIPITLVLMVVDVWSVYFGPTHSVAAEIQEHPAEAELGQRFLLWYPNLTPIGEEGLAVSPSFGFGDLIVAAIFLEIARRFGLPLMRSLLALVAAIIASMLSALCTESGIPALPFMGIIFLGAHWPLIPKNRREITACVVFLISLFAILLLVVNPVASALWPHETP